MKKIFLAISSLLFLCDTPINAQAFQWAKQFASRNSYGTDVVVDGNLAVLSAGWFYDSVDLDPGAGVYWGYAFNNYSGNNSYVSKLDASGNFVWGHTYKSSFYNRSNAIDVDDQNNIIVMGQFRDSIDLDFGVGKFMLYDPNNNNSYYDNIFIAKYDPAGNFIWGKGLHGSSPLNNNYGLWGNGLKVDAGNNVIILGNFRDVVDFDPGPGVFNMTATPWFNNSYYGDEYLLKLDVTGNFVWALQWHTWGNNYNNNNNSLWGGNELDVDANDNIFFPITFRDSVDVDPSAGTDLIYATSNNNNALYTDISLLKISPSGVLLWHKEIGGPYNEYCNSLATDPAGNIFYSIQTTSNPIDMDPGPGVSYFTWPTNQWGKIILKLDNNGDYVWALKNMDNNYNNGYYGEGIATDTAGGLYLTTRIWQNNFNNNQWDLDPGPGAYIVSSAGSNDIAFQNLDNNGQFVWGGVMGGVSNDYSTDICTDNQRGVYLTGYFIQTADFDPTPATSYLTSSSTGTDAFVVKLNNCNKSSSQTIQHCDSVVYSNIIFYQDTVYQFHYTASNGCDSAHSVIIDVKKLANDTVVVDTCKYYVWNNTTYTNSGYYVHNYGLPNGCDSIITLALTITQGALYIVNITGCDSAAYLGTTYYLPGSYLLVNSTAYGCDSNTVVNFIKSPVDTSLSFNGVATLTANAGNATYQWVDCDNNYQAVAGNTPFFTATASGNYACIITQNGCADTSNCHPITIGTSPNAVADLTIISRIYPNPSAGSYQLELDKNYPNVTLEIRTISGQLVWQKDFDQLKQTNIEIEKAAGVYMLYIKQGGQQQVKKLLKW